MCAFLAFHAINPHSHTSARARKCVSFYFYIGCAGYIQHGNAYTIVYWNVQFNLLFVNEWNGTVFPSVASTLYANWMLNCIYKLRNGICQEWRKKNTIFNTFSFVFDGLVLIFSRCMQWIMLPNDVLCSVYLEIAKH